MSCKSTTWYLILYLTINRSTLVTRELSQLSLINLTKLWAAELRHNLAENVGDWVEEAEENIWLGLSSKLEDEASKVVALCKVAEVDEAA